MGSVFDIFTSWYIPSENKKSKYGLPNGIIKTNWGYINYPFLDNWNKFWSEFSLYKVGPIISESLSIRVFNISKRISRGELIYYYISYQIIILIFCINSYDIDRGTP